MFKPKYDWLTPAKYKILESDSKQEYIDAIKKLYLKDLLSDADISKKIKYKL